LSDQVAIAINNQQLYADTARALEESERVHRQYLKQEWARESAEIKSQSYKYTLEGLVPINEEFAEIKTVLQTARPVLRMLKAEGQKSARSVMAVPILLRGESIGAFHLQVSGKPDFEWSESDLNTVKSVADQVALTLENTRLFENTIKRANRERRVLEITSKLRSTNDSQNMLKIALEELSASLGANKAQIVLNLKDFDHPDSSIMGINTQALTSNPTSEDTDQV
jgi:GAF domain-containing protein